jgi:hypothetical protein
MYVLHLQDISRWISNWSIRSVNAWAGTAIPLQAWTGPEGSRSLRKSAQESGKVVSPMHRPPLLTRKYFWYSFLLEAKSTPGPQCGRKYYVNEKFQWQLGIQPATFRLVPQCLMQIRHRVPHAWVDYAYWTKSKCLKMAYYKTHDYFIHVYCVICIHGTCSKNLHADVSATHLEPLIWVKTQSKGL